MKILAIDTSCDETSVAIVDGQKVLANRIYSQIVIHIPWGGVVPSLAKRAHQERIDTVIDSCCQAYLRQMGKKSKNLRTDAFADIDAVAVTVGPGLAIALEVGLRKAKELAHQYGKKLIAVNHMAGHLYSCFTENSQGNPARSFSFPYLALLISGGHTQLVEVRGHGQYKILGQTVDDAAGEALDKAGKLLGLGYPGGPVMETLATQVKNSDEYHFTRPMLHVNTLDFSFSGLKTAFYYFLKTLSEEEKAKKTKELASAFQEAVFDTVLAKLELALKKTKITSVLVAGGVAINARLRSQVRKKVAKYNGKVTFPAYRYLNGDNAAMIGVAAHFQALRGDFVSDMEKLQRIPRLEIIASF